jgi:hypothetical protein
MDVRSMPEISGNRPVTSGMNGPKNEDAATVEITVGILKILAAFASTWTLLNVTKTVVRLHDLEHGRLTVNQRDRTVCGVSISNSDIIRHPAPMLWSRHVMGQVISGLVGYRMIGTITYSPAE